MIEYKEKEFVQKIPFKKTCDKCGFSITSDDEDFVNWQEFISITHGCGYGSVFGDCSVLKLDLCQNCFKELLEAYCHVGGGEEFSL